MPYGNGLSRWAQLCGSHRHMVVAPLKRLVAEHEPNLSTAPFPRSPQRTADPRSAGRIERSDGTRGRCRARDLRYYARMTLQRTHLDTARGRKARPVPSAAPRTQPGHFGLSAWVLRLNTNFEPLVESRLKVLAVKLTTRSAPTFVGVYTVPM